MGTLHTPITAKEVAAAVAALGFAPPSREVLAAIASVCRDQFLADVIACRDGRDDDGTARVRLEQVLGCTSAPTLAALRRLGLSLSLPDIVKAAQRHPVRFLSAISIASEKAHPQAADSKAFLAAIGGPPQQLEFDVLSAGDAMAAVPSNASSCGVGERPKLRSELIYGEKCAISFNAVDGPDGIPGVMVEAGARKGPHQPVDWDSATHVMLKFNQITAVVAVFRGWQNAAAFRSYGPARNQAFFIGRQPGRFYCKVSSPRVDDRRGGLRTAVIPPMTATRIASLFADQMYAARPATPQTDLMEFVRSAYGAAASDRPQQAC